MHNSEDKIITYSFTLLIFMPLQFTTSLTVILISSLQCRKHNSSIKIKRNLSLNKILEIRKEHTMFETWEDPYRSHDGYSIHQQKLMHISAPISHRGNMDEHLSKTKCNSKTGTFANNITQEASIIILVCSKGRRK